MRNKSRRPVKFYWNSPMLMQWGQCSLNCVLWGYFAGGLLHIKRQLQKWVYWSVCLLITDTSPSQSIFVDLAQDIACMAATPAPPLCSILPTLLHSPLSSICPSITCQELTCTGECWVLHRHRHQWDGIGLSAGTTNSNAATKCLTAHLPKSEPLENLLC